MPSYRPWDQIVLGHHERLRWAVRDVRIYLQRDSQAWWYCSFRGEQALLMPDVQTGSKDDGLPEKSDLSWRRWAFGEERPYAVIRPAVPDRPLVVRTDPPAVVPPECRATFYLAIPVWAAIAIPSPERADTLRDLQVVPSDELSSTWFGDLGSGILSYSLTSTAQPEVSMLPRDPLSAVCCCTLFNKSTEDLPVEKICLQASHLALFESGGRLWTNEAFVSIKGGDEGSRVRFGKLPPRTIREPVHLREAEKVDDDNPLKRSFLFGR
ncbi:MAG: hypothetical protein ACFB21_10095 [Opitutales bacterium]